MLCSLHRRAEKLHGSSALAAAVPGVVHCPVKRAQCGRSPSLNSCRMVLLPRPLGIKLELPHNKLEFRVSTLEELYVKNLVSRDNLVEFRNLYSSKKDKLCFLGLTENSQEFIFMSAIT